jgi:hypothetical protein
MVFVPVAKEPAARPAPHATPRHGSHASLVIGLLDNHKHNSDKVLDRLQQRLAEKVPAASFVRLKKPEAGKGAPKAMLDELAAQCHAVVTGIGD